MKHDHVLKKLNFDLQTSPPGSRVGDGSLRAKYSLPCCCIRDSIIFDMQHDHVLKKLNLDLSTSPQGREGSGVCRHNICYHTTMLLHASFPLI